MKRKLPAELLEPGSQDALEYSITRGSRKNIDHAAVSASVDRVAGLLNERAAVIQRQMSNLRAEQRSIKRESQEVCVKGGALCRSALSFAVR